MKRFDDYVAKLEQGKVVLDAARRMDMIRADAKNLAFAQGYELVEDEGLLAEVAGLVEWPVTLMGSFDAAFLTIPGEVIRSTIRTNQKCFVLRDPRPASWSTNSFSSPISKPPTAARPSSPAMSASSARACRTPSSSTKPI